VRIAVVVVCVMFVALIRCALGHAEAAERYSAHGTLRKAGVGTLSPRVAAVPKEARASGDFERMHCYADPTRRLPATITCERHGSE